MRIHRSYRRATSIAVAAVVLAGISAPAAMAAVPGHASSASTVVPSPDTPLTGGLLTLDLATALKLGAHGVAVAVDGKVQTDAVVRLKVGSGSKVVHQNRKLVGGTVVLDGTVELTKGSKKITVSRLSVDIATGAITADVDARTRVKIGSVVNPKSLTVKTDKGSTTAVIMLADQGVTLSADLLARIDAALDTKLSANVDVNVNAALDVDAALAVGGKVNLDLAAALGLNTNLSLSALLGLDAILGVHLL
ncbi:hypothetical protein [Streptomyces indicus]|uniref:Uncharacterized protein n=1 Tax=Streptomyces indicus TaxID=417292 RepID=A0A1G9GPS3_9ACTN|nr:hypothetical protein [Streptomyces indicus]SDL02638.1 hypothetical protein SAMN05421806_116132 [Streptomyces indicus]